MHAPIISTCLIIIAPILSTLAQPQTEARKLFPGSITRQNIPVAATPKALSPQDQTRTMEVEFSLARPADKEFKSRVLKGERISPEERLSKYSPSPDVVRRLSTWLGTNGYVNVRTNSDGTKVYASSSVTNIESTLKTDVTFVPVDGTRQPTAVTVPSLPESVGSAVISIHGLQPLRAIKHTVFMRAVEDKVPRANSLHTEAPPQAQPAIANRAPYTVAEILKAYNGHSTGLTGKGQSIAILIDTAPDLADLTAFWGTNNVNATAANITVVPITAQPLPPKQLEETLDAEWTSGIAPDARIRIYATSSLAFIDLDKGLDRIIADAEQDPSLRQLSISLGLGETYLADVNGQPGDVIVSETDRYLTLASLGVNVFVSSGDGGSNPGPTGKGPSQGNPMQVEYPASDPFVIGVGGTSLTLDQRTGIVTGETSWFSGGGGISRFFGRPEWQKGSGLDSGGFRYVPDVSLAADPDTGALVIYQGQQTVVGGTSWSAPVWAGICALINEARNKQQKQALPYLNPNLYRLIGSDRIRDITSGSNMGFNAGPGYDATTGIGVPHLANLVAYFASLP